MLYVFLDSKLLLDVNERWRSFFFYFVAGVCLNNGVICDTKLFSFMGFCILIVVISACAISAMFWKVPVSSGPLYTFYSIKSSVSSWGPDSFGVEFCARKSVMIYLNFSIVIFWRCCHLTNVYSGFFIQNHLAIVVSTLVWFCWSMCLFLDQHHASVFTIFVTIVL